jgi:hypothetical protein
MFIDHKLRRLTTSRSSLILRRFFESTYNPRGGRMASKESAVKKYIATLSDEEREQLAALIYSKKHPAQKLLKARFMVGSNNCEVAGTSDRS